MENKEKKIVYIAVKQTAELDRHPLQYSEFDEIFVDEIPRVTSRRNEFEVLLTEVLRKGDRVCVQRFEELGTSLRELYKNIERIVKRGGSVSFVREDVIFALEDVEPDKARSPFEVLQMFAEFELSLIKKRQRAGIHAARAEGKHLGRPRKITDGQREEILEKLKIGESPTKIAKAFKISRGSVYNIASKNNNEHEQTDVSVYSSDAKNEISDSGQSSHADRTNITESRIAYRLAREMTEKYEKKHHPIFEDLFAAIIEKKFNDYEMIKEQVKRYTGYSTYKSSYLVSRIVTMLQNDGLITMTGDKKDKIVWG